MFGWRTKSGPLGKQVEWNFASFLSVVMVQVFSCFSSKTDKTNWRGHTKPTIIHNLTMIRFPLAWWIVRFWLWLNEKTLMIWAWSVVKMTFITDKALLTAILDSWYIWVLFPGHAFSRYHPKIKLCSRPSLAFFPWPRWKRFPPDSSPWFGGSCINQRRSKRVRSLTESIFENPLQNEYRSSIIHLQFVFIQLFSSHKLPPPTNPISRMSATSINLYPRFVLIDRGLMW